MTAPTPMTAAEIAALRDLHSRQPSVFPQKRLSDLWRQSGGKWHGPYVETYAIPEERFEAFCMAIEARLLATIEAQAAAIATLKTLLKPFVCSCIHTCQRAEWPPVLPSDCAHGNAAQALKETRHEN